MDDYRAIEIKIAKKYGSTANGTKKSIGDFLLDNNVQKPVNVKSNNLAKKNYSPNIISAQRLIKWLAQDGNELYFIFVDYNKTKNGIEIVKESELIPVHQISWDCLTIEAQGWGVIQKSKPLIINKNQDIKAFYKGFKMAYEKFIEKEANKMATIKEMIKDF